MPDVLPLGTIANVIRATSMDPHTLYELCGVLYHQGNSAYVGHYTADVWDPVCNRVDAASSSSSCCTLCCKSSNTPCPLPPFSTGASNLVAN